ncbi:MAG: TonB-dependent receptor [Culturomica sp.]|nr:TonB-dependent receptor [Culturomica sp.]
MRTKHLILLLLINSLINVVYAQLSIDLTTIQGQVVDSVTLEPIPYATVLAIKENSDYTNGTTTDLDGNFSFKVHGNAEYKLDVSCIGYESSCKRILLSNAPINIGRIILRENLIQLSEVAVIARKKRIKLSSSGLMYDMKNDPLSQSDNLLFALRNVPLVTVDGNGRIQVKGSSSFSVYINGKPYRMATMDPKTVLQTIPASSISKVELITNLDASYDASVGNAVINIITEKKSLDGYNIVIDGSVTDHPETKAGVTTIITKGKFDVSLSYNHNYKREINQKSESNRDNIQDGVSISRLRVKGIGNGNYTYHTGRSMIMYNIDSLNSLYADAHLLLTGVDADVIQRRVFETDVKRYTENKTLFNTSSGTSEYNVFYQNLYKKDKSERFSLGYRYAYNPDKRNNEVTGNEYLGTFVDWDVNAKEYTHYKNETNGGLNEHTIQSDYRLPLGKRQTFRFGGKYILRNSKAVPKYFIRDDNTDGWIKNNNENDIGIMKQTQDIISSYLTYTYKKGKFGFNVGGRLEYSYNKISFKDNPQSDLTSDFLNFIPRGNVSWTLSSSSQVRIAFSSGVIRPSIWNMNPFRSQLSEFDLSYGNPDLKSERTYSTNLSYMTYNNKWFLALDLDYGYTKDAIVRYFFRDNNDPKLLVHTYGNTGKYHKFGGSFYLNYKPNNTLSFSANGTLTNNNAKSDVLDVNQNKLSYNASISCDASLPKSWLVGGRFSIFQQTPDIRTYYNHFQMYSFYVYKRFMDGNLRIGVIAEQPFNKYSKHRTTYKDYNLIEKNINYIKDRSFGINLSYSFGSGKVSNIKRNKKIQNTDLQQSTGVQ